LKLQKLWHVACGSAGQLVLTVMERTLEVKWYQGKPKRQCMNDNEQWMGRINYNCRTWQENRKLIYKIIFSKRQYCQPSKVTDDQGITSNLHVQRTIYKSHNTHTSQALCWGKLAGLQCRQWTVYHQLPAPLGLSFGYLWPCSPLSWHLSAMTADWTMTEDSDRNVLKLKKKQNEKSDCDELLAKESRAEQLHSFCGHINVNNLHNKMHYVCLCKFAGRTAEPIKTKLGIGTHVDPRSVLVKVKVIYLCARYNRIRDRDIWRTTMNHARSSSSAVAGATWWMLTKLLT